MPLTKIQSLGITDGTIVNADINASAAIAGTKLTGVGKVLQVVQATNTTAFSTSSTSFVTTGFSASITPSSTSNKILVMFSSFTDSTGSARAIHWRLYRGATGIGDATAGMAVVYSDASRLLTGLTNSYLDSPSTTSSTTYTSYIKSPSGSSVGIPYSNSTETFILLEIAG